MKKMFEEAAEMAEAKAGKKNKYSQDAQEEIGEKMHQMKGEDRPQKQKAAIAISEARKKGLKVPPPKGKM